MKIKKDVEIQGEAKEITLGKGEWILNAFFQGKRHGLIIQKAKEITPPGTILENEEAVTVLPNDIIIWFDNLKGARAMQDCVNRLALNMFHD